MKKELRFLATAFRAEWLKIKGLGLLTFGIAIAAILPLLMFVTHIFFEESRNFEGAANSYPGLFIENGLSSYVGFFLLLFIIIAAARVTQTDHKNNGWVFMETQPLSKFSIYGAKFLAVVLLSFISIVLFFLFSILISYIDLAIFPREKLHFDIDILFILRTFIRVFVMVLGIISFQLMLSVMIPGFIWPFVIGFVGFVVNVVARIRQETYDFLVYNNLDTSLHFTNSAVLNRFFNYSDLLSIFWAVFFFIIGYQYYRNRGLKNAFFKNAATIAKTVGVLAVFVLIYFFLTKPMYPQKLENITIIEGTLQTDKPVKEIYLMDQELQNNIAVIPVVNNTFRWETKESVPFSNYIIDVEKRFIPIVLSKGDHLQFEIKKDDRNFDVLRKGTRKAEIEYQDTDTNMYSSFYNRTVQNKELADEPKAFYREAKKEWETLKKDLSKFRTKENIHFGEDFKNFKMQQGAVKMLGALHDYQMMTSFTDKEFQIPADFKKELETSIKKPAELLMTTDEYKAFRLKSLLPKEGTKNPDSIIFAKLSALPRSIEKDRLLSFQLLKILKITNDEEKRNSLYEEKSGQFMDSRYRDHVNRQLVVINNQQKGKPFPVLQFEDEEGKTVNLEEFKGKYVVIDFWATWCAPCKETSPVFEYRAKEYAFHNNIVFLAASIDEDKNKWKLGIKNNKSDVTQWWLKDKKALNSIGVQSIPRFMMIDPDGKIYNADMPRPGETAFQEILDEVSGTRFNFNMIF